MGSSSMRRFPLVARQGQRQPERVATREDFETLAAVATLHRVHALRLPL
jgi:hypothetical protein